MKLLSNSALYFCGSIVSKLLTLVSLPFLTATLAPEEYGVIAILVMIGVFSSSILSLGLGTSIGEIYYNKQNPDHKDAVITSGFLVLLGTHIFYCLLVVSTGNYISELAFDVQDYAYVSVLMLIGQAIQNLAFPLQLKVQFEERFKVAALAMILASSGSVGLTLFLVVAMDRGLNGYAEGMFIGACLQLLIFLLVSHMKLVARSLSIAYQLIHKGWAMIFSFLFLFLIQYGVRLPIEWFGGLKVLGVYLIGVSLAAPLGMITTAFVNAWTPYALSYSDRPNEASEPLAVATRIYIITIGILVVLTFMLAPVMASVLVADRYYESYYIIGLSALWHYFSSIFLLLLPPVYFAGEVSRTVVRVQGFTVFVFMLISIPLIMSAPLLGAAASVALAGFVLVFAQLFWNKRLRASQYTQIHYDKLTLLLIAIIPLAGIFILLMGSWFEHSWISTLAGCMIIVILLKILIGTPQVEGVVDGLRAKLFKVR